MVAGCGAIVPAVVACIIQGVATRLKAGRGSSRWVCALHSRQTTSARLLDPARKNHAVALEVVIEILPSSQRWPFSTLDGRIYASNPQVFGLLFN